MAVCASFLNSRKMRYTDNSELQEEVRYADIENFYTER